jgi:hypothetical protein
LYPGLPVGENHKRMWLNILFGTNRSPLKVSIFAWRLLRDRLPTKANLVAQGIISLNAHYFVSGCGDVESTQHLFISCSFFASLWSLIRAWIDFSSADTQWLSDHFLQFTYSPGGLRARRSFLQLIWLGLPVCGLYGMKEIRDYSEIQSASYSRAAKNAPSVMSARNDIQSRHQTLFILGGKRKYR